ncbi:MAG: hypothetical protein QP733_05050 [Dialister micraerophilus]|uniref:hypothetical protein n=1 Tax=Dialister micraerophilus TaxID=309120 RepID=UPI002549F68F|nr:hypothetical protein [Dialister micraerophilus]MDK8253800.1 hypothetical protein [Dialister micraerophilus]
MEVITDIRIEDILWSGGKMNYEDYFKDFADDELEDVFNMIFEGRTPSETEVNDLFWFEPRFIAESLGYTITENGELVKE